jgi:hypothetical protein
MSANAAQKFACPARCARFSSTWSITFPCSPRPCSSTAFNIPGVAFMPAKRLFEPAPPSTPSSAQGVSPAGRVGALQRPSRSYRSVPGHDRSGAPGRPPGPHRGWQLRREDGALRAVRREPDRSAGTTAWRRAPSGKGTARRTRPRTSRARQARPIHFDRRSRRAPLAAELRAGKGAGTIT